MTRLLSALALSAVVAVVWALVVQVRYLVGRQKGEMMREMTEQEREDRIQSIIGTMGLSGIHVTYEMAAQAVDQSKGRLLRRAWREDDKSDAPLRPRH